MFINVKQIKTYVKGHEKQISKEAIEALNSKVGIILASAIRNTGHFRRITETEINYAKGV